MFLRIWDIFILDIKGFGVEVKNKCKHLYRILNCGNQGLGLKTHLRGWVETLASGSNDPGIPSYPRQEGHSGGRRKAGIGTAH